MSQGYVGDDAVREIRARVDLVELVSEFVNLKKQGRTYTALCPFHQEKTPSFHVDPEKQLFHCFGCGEGGDVFSFVMKMKGETFPEAMVDLAKRAGVILPQKQNGVTSRERRHIDNIRKVLELAHKTYRQILQSPLGKKGMDYLEKRGLTKDTIEKFGLGYAPPAWDFMVSEGKRAGFDAKVMLNAGLLVQRRSGGYYDRFRDRVVFPIYDSLGELLGFGGRSLEEGQPKYLNSPETKLFHKRRELYGLHLAKPAIRNNGTVIIVEGYMDVIACFQNGIDYAVAGMGTSLTHEQARTLLLMSNRVVLAYDQDDAGKKATMRAVEVIRQCGGRAYVARYDGAKDPDEFMQRKGIDEFICIIKSAVPDIEYLFSKSMIGLNTATVDGKIRAKEEVVPILALLKDDFELQAYLDEFSRNIGVEKDSLAKEVELYSQSVQNASKYKKSENRNTRNYGNRGIVAKLSERQGLSGGNTELDISRRKAEEGVIRCLVENTRLLQKVQEYFAEDDFLDPDARAAFIEISRGSLSDIRDDKVLSYIASLCARTAPVEDPERILSDCLKKMLSGRLKSLQDQMIQAERNNDESSLKVIREDYMRLLRVIKSKE